MNQEYQWQQQSERLDRWMDLYGKGLLGSPMTKDSNSESPAKEEISIWKSYVESPRWAAFPSELKRIAFCLNLKLKTDIDKRWLTHTVYFTLEGTSENIRKAQRCIVAAIKEFNGT